MPNQALQRTRIATVLAGQLKILIFQEAVHEDDGLAHTSGRGDEGFLACGAQAQIKRFEEGLCRTALRVAM